MASLPRRGKPKIMAPRRHGPEFSVDQTWSELSKNIREIQNHNAANLSFEENHRYAYNMVLYKHGHTLYRGVRLLVIDNLESLARQDIIPNFPTGTQDQAMQNTEEEVLLKSLRKVWDDHKSNMVRLGQILKYMDRVHTKAAQVLPTNEMGLELFLGHIMKSPIKEHIVTAILRQIQHERDGNVINRSVVKECVDVFQSLHNTNDTIYKSELEPTLLQATEDFYLQEGRKLATSCNAPEFLRSVELRFETETSRTHHYLSSQTATPLIQILKDTLLFPHIESIITKENSGLDVMVDNNQFPDLSRLYRLSQKVSNGLPCLRSSLKKSIIERGKEINLSSSVGDSIEVDERETETSSKDKVKGKGHSKTSGIEHAVKWVQEVLSLKDKIDEIWRESFESNREIESALNEAFGTFVNLNEKCSEFVSLFIDDNLKRGLKGKSEIEVDVVLDKTITIFRFITEKDVFEKYYKQHLSKRLLHGRSVSDDAERGMLAKLKVESGTHFTQKMEGMFNDMKISADITKDYLEHVTKTTAPQIELSVVVMTSNAWPMTHSSSSCLLPSEMAKAKQSFERFYLSRHSGRVLTWQYSLGNADVNVRFRTRVHELNVATFALVILLLFEELPDDQFLTYSEIKDATQIEEVELKRHLQSLACGKFKVLKKHPPGRDINVDDSFSFNNDFTAAIKKIKIATVSSKVETSEERKATIDRIEEERRHQIEACIVRIMKDRKIMTNNDLINEVTQQLTSKFLPEPMSIKKRIEGLIEREYLERCEDRKSYKYLA